MYCIYMRSCLMDNMVYTMSMYDVKQYIKLEWLYNAHMPIFNH